ncbi:MauE/DoxX family redox-associated membrane protein [Amycolatopsis kentuckyensis]|uniref:MauE/DoxX family redox-associated membrane protein n=1 Tax=Amycolatopsis kentuckyensis TaxID=218823 RepID=UPI000A3CC6F6|nr:MauE/DoxX family redox-associated membrane protein [Amycolatopsis kentuckyensis]
MLGAQFVLAARVLVGLVFVVAAAGKLAGRVRLTEFADALAPLGRSPVGWLPVAAATAVAELAVAVLVGFPATYRPGLGLATAILLVFCAAIARSMRLGRRVTCRCFGRSGAVLGRVHLVRNTFLAVVAGAATAVPPGPGLGLDTGAAAALVGAFAALVAINADSLAGLVGKADTAHR